MGRSTLGRLAILVVTLGQLPARAAGPEQVFVGYLYGEPRGIRYELYTHICHAFVVADGDGTIKPGKTVPSRDVTGDAHKAGAKVLISLGGWGWDDQFAAMVARPEAEERYEKAVLGLVAEYDYDGIDLDWEYPDTEAEVAGFERLARRFRAGLDGIGKEKGRHLALTMAASASPGTLRWLRTEFLLETMDWINVMTYDYTGDWTDYAGHHSPLLSSSKGPAGPTPSTAATLTHLLEVRKLPPDRLALGIPLDGRGFAVAEPYASTKGLKRTRRPPGGDFQKVRRRLDQGWTRRWDDETKNPWLLAPDHSSVIGYDDAESVALKAGWAREHGLRGVFFWEINADRLPDGSNPLQEAARAALMPGGGGN